MVQKNKNTKKIAEYTGMTLMTLAATLGMLELPDHPNSRVIVPNQPAFAFANDSSLQQLNPLRREREESAPHYISYSEVQRTPGRYGKY
jgi:hypothetical protein